MDSVMTRPTMLTVSTMVEIAVSTTSILITALIAHVIIKKTVLLDLLPLLLETGFVMTRPTMLTAIMMVEIAVSISTQITALIAYVIMKKTVLLESFPLLLEMAPVMTRPTMLAVIMMVETAVSLIQCHEILNIRKKQFRFLFLIFLNISK